MYCKLILIGRLGKDPEARGSLGNVAAIDVATTNYYTKKDGTGVEETEWTSCVAFGKTAESILRQSKKGDLVLVEGLKKTDTYEKDGQKRLSVFLQIDTFRRLSWSQPKKAEASSEPAAKTKKTKEAVIE